MRSEKTDPPNWKKKEHTVQTRGSARITPHTAPPRMDRYIEPGSENACKLHNYPSSSSTAERQSEPGRVYV